MEYRRISSSEYITTGVTLVAGFQVDNLQFEITDMNGRARVFVYRDGKYIGSPALDWLLAEHIQRWAPIKEEI